MTAFLPLLLVVFLTPVLVGVVLGAYAYLLPRHRLNVIFRACKRERRAGNVVGLPTAAPVVGRIAMYDERVVA